MARVGVVIVNRDGAAVLPRTLAALARQTTAPARTIVVDNASADGSADGLEERFAVEVVRLAENVGFAAANNLAVRLADDCDWVALLNPDAFPEPGWLAGLLAAAERRPDCVSFASRLLRADAPEELDGAGDAVHLSGLAWRRHHGAPAAGTATEEAEVAAACAAAALYRRDAFLAAGGFDERFFCYLEDVDLGLRLLLAGHRCLYVPDAVVHHVGSALAGPESAFTVYHAQRNLVWLVAKDLPAGLLLRSLPHHLVASALLLAWYAARGRGRVVLRAKLDALRDLPAVLRERRRVQAGRVVSASELGRSLERGSGAYRRSFARAAAVRREASARSISSATSSAGPG